MRRKIGKLLAGTTDKTGENGDKWNMCPKTQLISSMIGRLALHFFIKSGFSGFTSESNILRRNLRKTMKHIIEINDFMAACCLLDLIVKIYLLLLLELCREYNISFAQSINM